MAENNNITSLLNELLTNLSQSVNIDYLALITSEGKERVSVGAPGDLSRADLEQLLNTYFNIPENFAMPSEVESFRIIRQGMAECFVLPINGNVQLLAMASIERPSVLIRNMLTELLKTRERLMPIVENEWKETEIKAQPKQKKDKMIKEDTQNTGDALESIITNPGNVVKSKEASKFWDNATLEDQEQTESSQTISFTEAKRSGLVPDDKK